MYDARHFLTASFFLNEVLFWYVHCNVKKVLIFSNFNIIKLCNLKAWILIDLSDEKSDPKIA